MRCLKHHRIKFLSRYIALPKAHFKRPISRTRIQEIYKILFIILHAVQYEKHLKKKSEKSENTHKKYIKMHKMTIGKLVEL